MVSKKSKKKKIFFFFFFFFFFLLFLIGKIRHGIGKKDDYLIGNGAEIRPLEMGRKGPEVKPGFMLILQVTRSNHDSMNLPKN